MSAVGGPTPVALPSDAPGLLRELVGATHDMTAATRMLIDLARQQAEMSRQQLELARRAEQRIEEQRQAQRDEFQRWLGEYKLLGGRSGKAEKTIRAVLGTALAELVDYIEENDENLVDSDFIRRELSEKYGAMLAHLWSIHGVLKHLSAAEAAASKPNT